MMPPPPPILDDRKSLDHISRHFRSIRNFDLFDFFHKMAAGGHFGNHFRSHFSPFQINKNFFSQNDLPAAILDDRKSLFIAVLAIFFKVATGGHF